MRQLPLCALGLFAGQPEPLFKVGDALDLRRQLPLKVGDGLLILRLGDSAGMFPGLYRPVTLGDGAGGVRSKSASFRFS